MTTTWKLIKTDDTRKGMKEAIPMRLPNEVCICWFHAAHDFAWYNSDQIRKQCKDWRKHIKNGILTLDKHNNQTIEIEGKKYFAFFVQKTDTENPLPLDPIGLAYGFMVSGFGYYFPIKKQRDVLYEYLMKGQKQPWKS